MEATAKEGKERVLMIGIAQEKASVWRSWPRKGQEKAQIPEVKIEVIDKGHLPAPVGIGTAFWKTNAYAPFPVWLWLNGHEWAKRQLNKARIGWEFQSKLWKL
jgi:hypothetical protein